MGKATEVFVFYVAAVAVIAVSQVPVGTEAFLEPFASHLIAKKLLLKNGFNAPPAPAVQTHYIYYGGQYQHQARPSPPQSPPSVSYPAYGPQTTSYPAYGPQTSSYPAYGPQTSSYPAYGPPSYSGYNEQTVAVVKPAPPPSSSGYPTYGLPTYSGYSEQPALVIKPAPLPSYGPASNSGYIEQPAPVVKPVTPPPGCPPAAQVDYSNYAVHGGHGFGNNGGYGK